jgi:hypothetical protein
MRALVVFESMFGNTRTIAEAVADGLATELRVDLLEVGTAPTDLDEDIQALVVGAPTHAFGLSRPGSRMNAAEQVSGPLVSRGIGVREWLSSLRPGPAGVPATAFDTRVARPRLPGSAAAAAAKRLRQLGFTLVAPAASFYVTGVLGPLVEGEAERAKQWGATLASLVITSAPRRQGSSVADAVPGAGSGPPPRAPEKSRRGGQPIPRSQLMPSTIHST